MVPVLNRFRRSAPTLCSHFPGTGCRPSGTCLFVDVPGLWLLAIAVLAMLSGCARTDREPMVDEFERMGKPDRTSTPMFDPVPEGAMRVATFNLRYDNPADGEDRWENRKLNVARVIRESGAWVVGTQEGLAHQISWLDSTLADFTYVGVGRDDGAAEGEFTAIFVDTTRLRILESGTFWLSPTPETPSVGWDAALARICTYALLETAGDPDSSAPSRQRSAFPPLKNPVLLLNAHYDHIGEQARLESSRLLIRRIGEIPRNLHASRGPIDTASTGSLPVVLLGDLNARPEHPPIAELTRQLQDAFVSSMTTPVGPEGTFNGFEEAVRYGARIDYVLHSDNLKAYSYRTFDRLFDGRFPSDHFPVVVDLGSGNP